MPRLARLDAPSVVHHVTIRGIVKGDVAANPNITDSDMMMQGLILSNRVLGNTNAPALLQRAIAYLLEESIDIFFIKITGTFCLKVCHHSCTM